MIPSLIDQVVAARIPSNREATVADAREDRLRTLLETVRRIGNVTPAALAPITGRSERWCREQLHELERRGQLYSWTPRRNVARMWGGCELTRDEIIRLATEAGIESWWNDANAQQDTYEAALIKFASLAAAAEREACAKVCDEEADRMESEAQRAIENGENDEVSSIRSSAWKLSVAANRIRARGAA